MKKSDAKNLAGYCGLYCGLCSKYQSKAPSRCVGCRPGEQHAWCSIWNCCAKKHGFESCAECGDVFHCPIFVRRKVTEWIPVVDNLRQIQEAGLERWLAGQMERQRMLGELLRNYNEGRSMSFYCKACARMPVHVIRDAVEESESRIANEGTDPSDIRAKAKIMKSVINEKAGLSDRYG